MKKKIDLKNSNHRSNCSQPPPPFSSLNLVIGKGPHNRDFLRFSFGVGPHKERASCCEEKVEERGIKKKLKKKKKKKKDKNLKRRVSKRKKSKLL